MGLEAYWADFKTTFQMEMLRNRSPEMAMQELHLRLPGHDGMAEALLPLSNHPRLPTAPASWTHSMRFAWQFSSAKVPREPQTVTDRPANPVVNSQGDGEGFSFSVGGGLRETVQQTLQTSV